MNTFDPNNPNNKPPFPPMPGGQQGAPVPPRIVTPGAPIPPQPISPMGPRPVMPGQGAPVPPMGFPTPQAGAPIPPRPIMPRPVVPPMGQPMPQPAAAPQPIQMPQPAMAPQPIQIPQPVVPPMEQPTQQPVAAPQPIQMPQPAMAPQPMPMPQPVAAPVPPVTPQPVPTPEAVQLPLEVGQAPTMGFATQLPLTPETGAPVVAEIEAASAESFVDATQEAITSEVSFDDSFETTEVVENIEVANVDETQVAQQEEVEVTTEQVASTETEVVSNEEQIVEEQVAQEDNTEAELPAEPVVEETVAPAKEFGAGEIIVDVRGLTVQSHHETVLDNVTLMIRKGEVHVVLGANDSGKTMLLDVITKRFKKYDGAVIVFGNEYNSEEAKEVKPWERFAYLGRLSLEDHDFEKDCKSFIRKESALMGFDPLKLLEGINLADPKHINMEDFTKGERARIQFAHALYSNHDVVVMDDILEELDPAARKDLLLTITKSKVSDKTVVIATNIHEGLDNVVDTVSVLDKKKVVFSGSINILRGDKEPKPTLAQVVLGFINKKA